MFPAPPAAPLEAAPANLAECVRRVEAGDPPGAVQEVSDIAEPDDLTVGGMPERHPEAVEVEWAARYAP